MVTYNVMRSSFSGIRVAKVFSEVFTIVKATRVFIELFFTTVGCSGINLNYDLTLVQPDSISYWVWVVTDFAMTASLKKVISCIVYGKLILSPDEIKDMLRGQVFTFLKGTGLFFSSAEHSQ